MTIYSDKEICAVCGEVMEYDGSVDDEKLGRITCCMPCYTSGKLKIWREELDKEVNDYNN